ncbi:MAG: hypothetical protein ABIA93_02955 [Candidatus Woesearchaeota archaeon]
MRKSDKKAQAAMEFLTTYGWAIIGVLIVAGALAYINVNNLDLFRRDKCDFGAQLICRDFELVAGTTGLMHLMLQNGYGEDINVKVRGQFIPELKVECPSVFISKGQIEEVNCTLDYGLEEGAHVKIPLAAEVNANSSSVKHNVTGMVRGKV